MSKPILIGITGGTGSGKSTIADALYSNFSNDCIAMIQQDMYYKDQSHLSMEERVKTNYDHPMAFDNDLLVEHLKALINGESIDIKVYVDTDADIRILRRLVRDINERGRTVESVVDQYLNIVRPMHLQFTEPSKKYADIIIPEGGHNYVAIDLLMAKIRDILK